MKEHHPSNANDIAETIKYFNSFHDGVIKSISFQKDRNVLTEDGGVVFPGSEEDLNTTVVIEMILNSYENAKNDQTIQLILEDAKHFNFNQSNFDCSAIYEVSFEEKKDSLKTLVFKAEYENVEFLTITFENMKIIEY